MYMYVHCTCAFINELPQYSLLIDCRDRTVCIQPNKHQGVA